MRSPSKEYYLSSFALAKSSWLLCLLIKKKYKERKSKELGVFIVQEVLVSSKNWYKN